MLTSLLSEFNSEANLTLAKILHKKGYALNLFLGGGMSWGSGWGYMQVIEFSLSPRWECMESLKEEKGSELIGVADVKTFLQDCQGIGVLLQNKMVQLRDLEPGNSPAGLESNKRKLSAVEREVLVMERKIEYLRSVAKS